MTFEHKDITTLGGFNKQMFEKVNRSYISNFNEIAEWIKNNYPNLNGKFELPHNPYYWIKLVVVNGKAYLQTGSHGYSFDIQLSTTETALLVSGSEQRIPYAYSAQFFRNDRLLKFLENWKMIKQQIIAKGNWKFEL